MRRNIVIPLLAAGALLLTAERAVANYYEQVVPLEPAAGGFIRHDPVMVIEERPPVPLVGGPGMCQGCTEAIPEPAGPVFPPLPVTSWPNGEAVMAWPVPGGPCTSMRVCPPKLHPED